MGVRTAAALVSRYDEGADRRAEGPASRPRMIEFFAGSGLVAEGISPHFEPIWANDLCEKKASVYKANHLNILVYHY